MKLIRSLKVIAKWIGVERVLRYELRLCIGASATAGSAALLKHLPLTPIALNIFEGIHQGLLIVFLIGLIRVVVIDLTRMAKDLSRLLRKRRLSRSPNNESNLLNEPSFSIIQPPVSQPSEKIAKTTRPGIK